MLGIIKLFIIPYIYRTLNFAYRSQQKESNMCVQYPTFPAQLCTRSETFTYFFKSLNSWDPQTLVEFLVRLSIISMKS